MARYKSRATRAGIAADNWREIAQKLRDLIEDANAETSDSVKAAAVKEAQTILDTLDMSEIESLAEEMGSWRDNMQGTALENTQKFSAVEECASSLEQIDTDAPDIADFDDIESVADDLENRADEIEAIEFPGMYG